MRMVDIMPVIMGGLVAAYALSLALSQRRPGTASWALPAIMSALFLIWSSFTVLTEGATGFWSEHTRNLWGNQIWFDLLFAAAVALTVMVPRARALGMRPLPWSLAVLATGSVALLAMFARMAYLESRKR